LGLATVRTLPAAVFTGAIAGGCSARSTQASARLGRRGQVDDAASRHGGGAPPGGDVLAER
jgi:hypothetical protein